MTALFNRLGAIQRMRYCHTLTSFQTLPLNSLDTLRCTIILGRKDKIPLGKLEEEKAQVMTIKTVFYSPL
jgi:hypothetical protein